MEIEKTTLRAGGRDLPALRRENISRPDICPECGGEAKTPFTFSGQGEVYSYTHMANAPAGFEEQAPYTIALVKLTEGPMVTAQLTDLGDEPVRIGMPVEMVTRKIRNDGDERGIIVYGYKFRPVGLGPH